MSGDGPAARRRRRMDLSPGALERVEAIRERTRASTNGEVVRDALRLYEWLLDQQGEGFRIRLTRGDRVLEVELLGGG